MYKVNFSLFQHHNWSLSDLEGMLPWERYIYIDMLQQYLDEKEKERQLKEQEMKAQMRSMENKQKMNAQRRR